MIISGALALKRLQPDQYKDLIISKFKNPAERQIQLDVDRNIDQD